ncbi:hypothetical protein GCK72_009488 [Caenorhabditis remanei]|uniref:Uncharacterized protein n=1 Tax=Caenorhabditis remanei TaxID=31234 RepID=A0A6A5H371_CAERE|nr:hypothetical protein GCK72_009488 [Caenorhabditis remanei]KAF1761234.1 hypothetical protein GCK72_009488 [Caenorhabditis remanei]
MIHDWLSRIRYKRRTMPTERSISTATTSTTVDSTSTFQDSRKIEISREANEAAIKIINYKIERCNDYCDEDAPDSERCGCCGRMKGKFIGDGCLHYLLCRMCCYRMILKSLKNYQDGPLNAECPACVRTISTLTRVKRSQTAEGNEENLPIPEKSISIRDFTKELGLKGLTNNAYESSGSL